MAGGYYTPSPTDTLTAANWRQYVRDQTINQFANVSARTSAIGSPVEGMYADLADSDALLRYDGTAWRPPNILFVRRTTDSATITSNATLTDDTVLFLTVPANATFELNSLIIYTSGLNGDLKIGWSAPAGSTLDWNIGGPGSNQDTTTGVPYNGAQTLGGSDTVGGTQTNVVARPSGLLVVGSTSGQLKLRWAQGISDAGFGTVIRAGSYIRLTRVA